MSGSSIRVTRDFYAIRVFINDLLHVHVWTDRLLAIQAWVDHPNGHCIEYVMVGGTMRTDYADPEVWKEVICGIEGRLVGAREIE